MSVQMEVWGDYALWTRPELKTERYSYDVPTPSGVRGMLESIYWHPGLRYVIDRIYVMNPIRFTNLRRNEVKSKVLASAMLSEANGKAASYIDRNEDIQQRATTMLRDVHYVIEAHFEMTDQANESDNPGKFQDIIKRRLRRGQAYSQPYWARANARRISACGKAARFRQFQKHEIWALCCMIWIFLIQTTISRCFSALNWKTACST